MKYVKKFQSRTTYTTWKSGSFFVTPSVSFIDSSKEVIFDKLIDNNGHLFVDLGLPSGILWAAMNIGAAAIEEYGDYYAWGEVETKSTYSDSNYIWGNISNTSNITKYNSTDGLNYLLSEDDAAHVNWGGSWRMPGDDDIYELIQNTSQAWETINGINGMRFTGDNGNSIFIPAGGNKVNKNSYVVNEAVALWSANRGSMIDCGDALGLSQENGFSLTNAARSTGKNIRPVLGISLPSDSESMAR